MKNSTSLFDYFGDIRVGTRRVNDNETPYDCLIGFMYIKEPVNREQP